MKLSIPGVVDDLKDTASAAYAAWPDRIFVVGTDLKIAYAGGRGPGGFKPDEAKAALRKILAAK